MNWRLSTELTWTSSFYLIDLNAILKKCFKIWNQNLLFVIEKAFKMSISTWKKSSMVNDKENSRVACHDPQLLAIYIWYIRLTLYLISCKVCVYDRVKLWGDDCQDNKKTWVTICNIHWFWTLIINVITHLFKFSQVWL